jgi:hypothetical protein
MTADAKSAFYAWRGATRKRASTDLAVLEDPLVREAFSYGYYRGQRDRIALESEFAGAIDVCRRVADVLEDMARERDAVAMVGAEEYAEEYA